MLKSEQMKQEEEVSSKNQSHSEDPHFVSSLEGRCDNFCKTGAHEQNPACCLWGQKRGQMPFNHVFWRKKKKSNHSLKPGDLSASSKWDLCCSGSYISSNVHLLKFSELFELHELCRLFKQSSTQPHPTSQGSSPGGQEEEGIDRGFHLKYDRGQNT